MKMSAVTRICATVAVVCVMILALAGCAIRVKGTKSSTSDQLELPVNAINASNVGSLEFELVYDPSKFKPEEVLKGQLADNAMLDYSTALSGRVWVAIVDSNGISGNGSLAVVTFSNIGKSTTSTTFTIQNVRAYNSTTLMDIKTSTNAGNPTSPPAISFLR